VFVTLTYAASSFTHTSQSDFQAGSVSSDLSSTDEPGALKLKASQSFTNTTETDFNAGITQSIDYISNFELTNVDNGEMKLAKNAGYCYDRVYPKLGSVYIHAFDNDNNLIFFGTNVGVQVLDTKGSDDPTDDELITEYTTTSTPAYIGHNNIINLNYDNVRNLLYVSTLFSADVIDTKGNADPSDDVTVASYTEFSTPVALDGAEGDFAQMIVHDMIYDDSTEYLWIRTANGGGLEVIDTNGTPSMADDTYVTKYHLFTTPTSSGGSQEGLAVIDGVFYEANSFGPDSGIYVGNSTLGTNIGKYSANSTPPTAPDLPDDEVRDMVFSESEDRLYVLNYYDITVIDIQGTPADIGDDTIVSTHHSTDFINAFNVDVANGRIYTTIGTEIIVLDSNDLTEITRYNASTTPKYDLGYTPGEIRVNDDKVYFLKCMFPVANFDKYFAKAQFTSEPFTFNLNSSKIRWSQTKTEDQSINVRYRTADADNDFVDEFDDNSTSNIGDYFSYGASSIFGIVEESNGILTLGDTPDSYNYIWIDTGKPDNYYPAGSIITVRLRVNTSDSSYGIWLIGDDYDTWSDEFDASDGLSDWTTIRFTTEDSFSKVGIELDVSGEWQDGDNVEIESMNVRNSVWSSWSTNCSDNEGCDVTVPDGDNLLQYQVTLTSDPTLTSTPTLNSITVGGLYPATAEYTSAILDGGAGADWQELNYTGSTPTGTSITFYTRSGNTSIPDGSWSAWEGVNSPIASPNNQYLQYKATLASTDIFETPTLDSVTIQYAPASNNSDNGGNEEDNNAADNVKIVINSSDGTSNGKSAKYTYDRKVKVFIKADANGTEITEMKISTSKDFGNKDWVRFIKVRDFIIDDKYGKQTVYVKLKSGNGNTSKTYSQDIEFRQVVEPPDASTIIIPPTGTDIPSMVVAPLVTPESTPTVDNTIQTSPSAGKENTHRNNRNSKELSKIVGETLSAFSVRKEFGVAALLLAISPYLISSIMEVILSLRYVYFRSLPSIIVGLIKKKKYPWGVVYDAVNKQPVDPAIITLTDESGKNYQTVTDMYGRYEFFVNPGKYHIKVEKTSFAFPSKIITNSLVETVYPDILTSTEIQIYPGQKVDLNIPMDPVEGNWNQIQKIKMGIKGPNSLLAPLATLAFWLGMTWNIAAMYYAPTESTWEIGLLFACVLLYRTYIHFGKSWGVIHNKKGQPLAGIVVKLGLAAFPNVSGKKAVTDYLGRYNFLVEKGTFKIMVDEELNGQHRRLFESKAIKMDKKFGSVAQDIAI
jgi:hypothetical protein